MSELMSIDDYIASKKNKRTINIVEPEPIDAESSSNVMSIDDYIASKKTVPTEEEEATSIYNSEIKPLMVSTKNGDVTYEAFNMLPSADTDTTPTEFVSKEDDFSRTKEAYDDFSTKVFSDKDVTDAGYDTRKKFFEEQIKPNLELEDSPAVKEFIDFTGEFGLRMLMGIGGAVNLTSSIYTDAVQEALQFAERNNLGFDVVKNVMSFGGKFDVGDTPEELAESIASETGTLMEFVETLPFVGAVKPFKSAATKAYGEVANLDLDLARRYNVGGARLATLEAAEEARLRAAKIAKDNPEIGRDYIINFEKKIGARDASGDIIDEDKIVSTEVNGILTLDFDRAKEVGKATSKSLYDADQSLLGPKLREPNEFIQLAAGGEEIFEPILNPDKFNAMIALAVKLKDRKPKAFDNNNTIIENLFDYTVKGDLDAQELVDDLNDYGLSFEDYVLTIVGSGSEAGRILNKLSQISRVRPESEKELASVKALLEAQYGFKKTALRLEGVRRGGLVSQIATAARNLTSGTVRTNLEGLGNVMDTALWEFSQPIKLAGKKGRRGTKTEGGFAGMASQIISGENWANSFSHMKYIYDRPDVAAGYTDLIMERPELGAQYKRMYDNLNEIQQAAGRGSGGVADNVISEMEDIVKVLNTGNHWQEFLIRKGVFFGEIQRLTKREYGIDLIDTIQDGKLKDLLNDASTVKPKDARSFLSIVEESTTKALDVTYGKSPDVPFFKDTSNWITRNGLTVFVEFPRFMFNNMELMGQYAGGASIPLTRKVMGLVNKDLSGPLTFKDRQRISRNMLGMATVGAAYQYRTSEDAPADWEKFTASEEMNLDTTPLAPVPQYMYLGEAVKRLENGTFDDWFDAKEFAETFAGSSLRTGQGNAILDEVASMAAGTDLTKNEAMGRLAGRALGNYLGTWAVPLAQLVEAQRLAGTTPIATESRDVGLGTVMPEAFQRGLQYKDAAKDPTLGFKDSFFKNLKRPLAQRGVTLSPKEEALLKPRKFLFAEGQEKSRVMPFARFGLGLNFEEKDAEFGEYLVNLGYRDYKVGSRSKVPTIKNFENAMLGKYLPTMVEFSKAEEIGIRQQYSSKSAKFKKEIPEEKFVNSKIKPRINARLSAIKSVIAEGSIVAGDEYTRAMIAYRKLPPDFRKYATIKFKEMFPDVELNPLNKEHLNKLVIIGSTYKDVVREGAKID